jgi:AAA domain/RepB DNA-primase N-terminal domain
MPAQLTVEEQLALISRAWGKQKGYCFFPSVSGSANDKTERRLSYREGPAFFWPRDRAKILDRMRSHKEDDLYWCPSLFEERRRVMELAMDEHALWADLDEVNPNNIEEDLRPTIAWESSPGRYQALWLITAGDMQGASWPGNENQKLTYYLGADASGWDTTQLLRIPGWDNHKPDYREANKGQPVQGKLLWQNGARFLPDAFEDLPEVQTFAEVQTVLVDEVERIDRHKVWGEVRLKLPHKAREMFSSREVSGDISAQLWWLMRCLADAGCSATEIVALVRPTPWNKFAERQDELKRLTLEASKAISQRSEEVAEDIEEARQERPEPQNLFALMKNVKAPEWIVRELIAVGSCGFVAGQPKVYKSWLALDLILSVSTGIPFLDHFPVRNKGPVLYIQEEDSVPMVKSRLDKVWPGKQADKMHRVGATVVWDPADPRDEPQVNALFRAGVTITDPGWQSWLDEQLSKGYSGEEYRMVLIDPLMMVAGEVDENRSQEMTTKLFKPLKQLADKHTVSVMIVHHMKKGENGKFVRGGQMMLGSTANHAWAENSLYIRRTRGGDIVVERESKFTVEGSFKVTRLRNKLWTPAVVDDRLDDGSSQEEGETHPSANGNGRSRGNGRKLPRALTAMQELGPGAHSTRIVSEQLGISLGGARRQLMRLVDTEQIQRLGDNWALKE